MTLADELRADRLRALHSEFLRRASLARDDNLGLFSLCGRSDDVQVMSLLAAEWNSDDYDRSSTANIIWREIWKAAGLPTRRINFRDLCRRRGFFVEEGRRWLYEYSEDLGDWPLSTFLVLGEEASREFALPDEPSAECWLATLYRVLPTNRETTIRRLALLGLQTSIAIRWLPWDLFTASAKAIEILTDSRNRPPKQGDPRPAYRRDHLWLKWKQGERLGPAKIRDRWDSLTDAERREICSTLWERVGGQTPAEQEAV